MKAKLLLLLFIAGTFSLFAQQYSTKQNAVNGITAKKDVNQVIKSQVIKSQERDMMVTFFSEDFEGGDLAAAGWTSIDNDGDGEEWTAICTNTTPHAGTCNATSASYSSSALTPDNYLISPAIDLSTASGTVFLQWYVAAQDQTWPSEYYEVMVSTTGNSVSDFTTTLHTETVQAGGPEPGNYWERSADLTSYSGQTIYLAFVHTNCTDMFRINLDDVMVYENTIVDAALTDIVAPNNNSGCQLAASESVTVTILNNGGAAITGFDVSYSINGGTAVTETVSASINPASSHDYTFTQTADLSALDYYTITANVSLSGDSDGSNDNYSANVSSTDASITIQVQSDGTGGQSWNIVSTSGDTIATHGAYQWNITETTDVCVIDNDCYTFNWYGGTSNTVTVSYNGTQVDQTTATADYSVYSIGGNCNSVDLKLDDLTFPAYATPGTDVDINGTVMNIGADQITSFDVTYTVDGGTPTATYSVTGLTLNTGDTYDFTHDVPFNTTIEDTYNIEVTISNVNGGLDADLTNNILAQNILITSSLMQRTVLFEEFSTEACPNCPQVVTYIHDYMASEPNFILMTHHAGYSTDDYTIQENTDMLELFNDGGQTYAPAGCADRYRNGNDNDGDGSPEPGPVFWCGDPYGGTMIDSRVAEPAFVDVNINGTYNSGTGQLDVTVHGDFLSDFTGDIGVSLWITEDGITTTTQSGYTGTWTHYYTVRDAISSTWGDVLSSGTTAGDSYSETYSYNVDGTWNYSELYLVALVNQVDAADPNNRMIHNAGEVNLPNLQPLTVDNYIVENNIHIYPNPTNGIVKFMNVENTTIEIYDIVGKKVITKTNNNSIESIDLSNLENGTYVVKIIAADSVVTKKIVLNK